MGSHFRPSAHGARLFQRALQSLYELPLVARLWRRAVAVLLRAGCGRPGLTPLLEMKTNSPRSNEAHRRVRMRGGTCAGMNEATRPEQRGLRQDKN